MEGHSVADDDVLASPTLPAAAIEAITAPRPSDAPRRCFICLTDEDPSDPPESWVDPCPCTLEAHQDCMLSWVTDCERSNKPLLCPVCKSRIELEGQWNLVVAASDALQRRFSRASPFMLLTGMSMGVQFSLQLYGALALWTFAGKQSLMQFLLGSDLVIDASRAGNLTFVKDRIWKALVLMNVAPALLFGKLLPTLSNKMFLPAASLYGMWSMMHHDDFVSWPPSPRLAIAVFPYVRSIYGSLWRELVLPYEIKLNRQLIGLPAEEQPGNAGRQEANRAQRNAEGGILGILQGIIDAMDAEDADQPEVLEVDNGDELRAQADVEAQGEIVLEVQIGEVGDDEDEIPVDFEPLDMAQEMEEPQQDEVVGEVPAPANARAVPVVPNGPGHEAPQAPPRRLGVGALLTNISNTIVSALVLPGVSLAMGEALRLVLPRAWTSMGPRNPWSFHSTVGRPGLLQQQWGRSLIGGCLFIILKDAVRVYSKSRRVAAMNTRRVKNVERRRRGRDGGASR
ncbi:hypothetical protein HIM_07305 [Hirsutella minnesotensis 3608]|uniref:RING-CH-type domain-containing protein n=1 Tax=Hirsutella minnesotensis 3608 TaxID=1043627 RepID=A0A0F7ZI01_9HYPO|nr:hypothetical protein HIM_07305 [Hirsutella minnesotensis 3608]